MPPITVYLHDYGRSAVGAGGAPLNYAEISGLLLARSDARAHDFHDLLVAGGHFAPGPTTDDDVLVCTAGPYAHLYHYWREVTGGRYRIIRDARTTAWSPYLAQEWLAAPLVRAGDLIVLPSEFASAFYRRLFSHITRANSRVVYPLADNLPAPRPRRPGRRLRIGYLGRLADDKNVPGVLELAVRLRAGQDVELHFAGPFYPRGRQIASPGALAGAAARAGLPADTVQYHGNLPYRAIDEFFAGIDLLYFPAVSSNESFGRVLVEAGRAGLPVVATDYAAAPELLPAANLVPVRYRPLRGQRLNQPFSLGEPDASAAVACVRAGPRAVDRSGDARYASQSFLALLARGPSPTGEDFVPSAGVATFLNGLAVTGLDPLDKAGSLARCAAQRAFLRQLLHPRLAERAMAVARLLRHLPGDPMLQLVARERLWQRNPPGVLRNAVAACRHVGFDPRLNLQAGVAARGP